jgi:hypothetical protein
MEDENKRQDEKRILILYLVFNHWLTDKKLGFVNFQVTLLVEILPYADILCMHLSTDRLSKKSCLIIMPIFFN